MNGQKEMGGNESREKYLMNETTKVQARRPFSVLVSGVGSVTSDTNIIFTDEQTVLADDKTEQGVLVYIKGDLPEFTARSDP